MGIFAAGHMGVLEGTAGILTEDHATLARAPGGAVVFLCQNPPMLVPPLAVPIGPGLGSGSPAPCPRWVAYGLQRRGGFHPGGRTPRATYWAKRAPSPPSAILASPPRHEWAEAQTLAARLDFELVEANPGEQDSPAYQRNNPDRCYHCKTHLYAALWPVAKAWRGMALHRQRHQHADDVPEVRPGLQAARGSGHPQATAGGLGN